MTELTPAVYDAAHQLGYAMARAGVEINDFALEPERHVESALRLCVLLNAAMEDGFDSFTPEAEAARLQAVVASNARKTTDEDAEEFIALAQQPWRPNPTSA